MESSKDMQEAPEEQTEEIKEEQKTEETLKQGL